MKRLLLSALAAAALWVVPAPAFATLSWDDAGAAAPATVAFTNVAAGPQVVVAVGSDTASGAQLPAIYRLAAGHWYQDVLTLPDGATGRLTAVALSGAGGVAIGSWTDGAGTHALVASIDPTALAADAQGTWTSSAGGTDPLPATPLSLALADDPASTADAPSAKGAIGADNGLVYRIDEVNGVVDYPGAPLAGDLGGASRIAGVAVFSDGSGLAAGNDANTGVPRIYGFDGQSSSLSAQPAVSAATPMVGLAAIDATHAVAIDASAYWQTDGTSWTRTTGNGDVFHDVAAANVGGQTQEAIAGANPSSGWGVVWRRTGSTQWTIDENVAAELNAVAIAPDGTLWAAGAGGAIKHLVDHVPPPPPPPAPTPAPAPTSGSGSPPPPPPPADQPQPAPSSDPGITVDLTPPTFPPDPREPAKPRPRRRLVQGIAVKVTRRGLLVTFTLSAPAKVALVAKRAGRVVGKTAARRLAPGRRQLLLTYTGKALPTELKIVARPAGKSRHGGTK